MSTTTRFACFKKQAMSCADSSNCPSSGLQVFGDRKPLNVLLIEPEALPAKLFAARVPQDIGLAVDDCPEGNGERVTSFGDSSCLSEDVAVVVEELHPPSVHFGDPANVHSRPELGFLKGDKHEGNRGRIDHPIRRTGASVGVSCVISSELSSASTSGRCWTKNCTLLVLAGLLIPRVPAVIPTRSLLECASLLMRRCCFSNSARSCLSATASFGQLSGL
mmetsp:Transcript_92414/g.258259  ORF Transcript_92414/g.258259 Transcript_92414/m.258259 type:complete len:220 (-) Transcript_92414:158-817(-)